MKRKAKSLQIFLLLMMVIGGSVQAQVASLDDVDEPLDWMSQERSLLIYFGPLSSFTYHAGYRNMGDYLREQTGNQFQRFSENVSFGLGWRKNRRFTNFHLAVPLFDNVNTNTVGNFDYHAAARDYSAEVTMGYAIVATDRRFLVLKGGIGFAWRNFQVRRTDNNPFNFDNSGIYTGQSWPEMDHYNGTYMIALEMMPRPLRKMSVIDNFQLGYIGGFGNPRWSSDEAELINPVADRVSVIFLRVNVLIAMER